jgi:hypothetical protein
LLLSWLFLKLLELLLSEDQLLVHLLEALPVLLKLDVLGRSAAMLRATTGNW